MKSILSNDYIVFAARIVLGFVFVVASIDKISDPAGFAGSIGNYKLVSLDAALISATILPWIELLTGLGLIFGIYLRGSALLILVMLFVFTAAVLSAVLRGLDISCGCFTRDPAVGKVGWLKVGENLLMLAGALLLYFSTSIRWTVERAFTRKSETSREPQAP